MAHSDNNYNSKKKKRSKLMDKIKMYDVAEDSPVGDEMRYPTIRLSTDQIEEIKHKYVGDECDLLVTAKVASKRSKKDGDEDEDEYNFTLDVKEIGFVK